MLSRNVSYDGLMRWGVELIHYLNGCGKGLDIPRRLVVERGGSASQLTRPQKRVPMTPSELTFRPVSLNRYLV
jgi:hypothetical protein